MMIQPSAKLVAEWQQDVTDVSSLFACIGVAAQVSRSTALSMPAAALQLAVQHAQAHCGLGTFHRAAAVSTA
jgi:hypothetical protein